MTPELEKVSESRRQAEGVRPVAKGTPSQVNYLTKNKDGKTYLFQKLELMRLSTTRRQGKKGRSSTGRGKSSSGTRKVCRASI